MPTRTFTTLVNRPERLVLPGLDAALAASDDTAAVNILNYNKIKAVVLTAGFSTGNITVTAQSSQDGTNWVTLGTALTITANGYVYALSSATAIQDITTDRFLRFIRGGDSNTGTVQVQLTAGNAPINLN